MQKSMTLNDLERSKRICIQNVTCYRRNVRLVLVLLTYLMKDAEILTVKTLSCLKTVLRHFLVSWCWSSSNCLRLGLGLDSSEACWRIIVDTLHIISSIAVLQANCWEPDCLVWPTKTTKTKVLVLVLPFPVLLSSLERCLQWCNAGESSFQSVKASSAIVECWY